MYAHIGLYLLTIAILISILIEILSWKLFINTEKQLEDNLFYIPILLWWTPFTAINEIIECKNEKYKCKITSNRTIDKNVDMYLFYGSRIENYDFPSPRNYQIPWALFHEESPKNYAPLLFEDTQSLFNVTSTFSQSSDFPITTQYLGKDQFDLLTDKMYYLRVEQKNKYLDTIAPVLYIQSDCDTPIGRDYLVKKLSEYIRIDSYGKCLTNKNFPKQINRLDPLDLYNEDYLQFISKYKFIIAFENSVCDDYITEKLWRPLIVGSIPIYYGSPTIEKWLPNPNSAILVKNFQNVKAITDFIYKVNDNDTLYNTFLDHKIYSQVQNNFLEKQIQSDNSISAFQCFICQNLHESTFNKSKRKEIRNIYNCSELFVSNKTTWHQHWEVGKCQSKALKTLMKKNIPFSSDYFDEIWKKFYLKKLC